MIRWIDEKFYPQLSNNWDDEQFRSEILQILGEHSRILDLGAGSGRLPQMDFSTEAGEVCGVDPDAAVLVNPHLDEARIGHGEAIPYEDDSFDMVFANNLLEHLADPQRVFREVARVLSPGGLFLLKTPNRRHYVPLIARCTPHGFHRWFNRLRGRPTTDTFPTLYRANSRRRIARLAAAADLDVLRISLREGRPEYLRFSGPSYLLGLVYERLVNSTAALAPFRVLIIAVLRKPPA